ncbi:MAG: hypothetical protein H6745_13245 [Deltaproteobacteria bacterium]|nr:hypothetical protein [Deltaproteobacteria bacterium]
MSSPAQPSGAGSCRARAALAVAALVVASASLAGCFESGALDDGDAAVDTVVAVDTEPPADTAGGVDSAEPDTEAPLDTELPVDTAEPPDTVADTLDAADTVDTSVEGKPCLTVSDCGGVSGPTNLCDGVVGCVDYTCRVDPATVVTCPDDGDPCTRSACDPGTGECVEESLCNCVPGRALACGASASFSAFDSGAQAVIGSYTCAGGAYTEPGAERVFTFAPSVGGRARLTFSPAAGSPAASLYATPYDGMTCGADACLAGGASRIFVDVTAGASYAVLLEAAAGPAGGSIDVACGVTAETACADGVDDDGDGQTDCQDGDCTAAPECEVIPTSEVGLCGDHQDNDRDNRTDCDDPDCYATPGCGQACADNPLNVHCGFSQGLPTGGGKAAMSRYTCHPEALAGGKEVAYHYREATTEQLTVTMSADNPALALYLLSGACAPDHCQAYGPYAITFTALANVDYYFVIDAPLGVTGTFQITVTCAE